MFDGIQFSSFADFLAMGGYAFNVWSVYLMFVIFVLFNLLGPLHRKKQIVRQLKRRQTFAGDGEGDGSAPGLIMDRPSGEST